MRKLPDIIAEQNREDPRDLRSRSDARKERRREEDHLAGLARRLVDASERVLSSLELPEPVADAVRDGRRIDSAIALKRQIRVIRAALRDADASAIEKRLEHRVAPDGQAARAARAAEQWCRRLTDEGDAALQELLSACPGADRQHLRQLARQARAAAPAKQARAQAALRHGVRAALAAGTAAMEESS
jgi:ribosome-associated protein